MPQRGVAAVVVGNEVLSAKVVEENGAHLVRELSARGCPLKFLCVVPDEVDAIVQAVTHARKVASHVLTSGGIGPTHDDVTVRGVALALGRRVERLPELVALVKKHYGDGVREEAFRLAEAPEGATLVRQPGIWYPVLACEGVFLLPGVPQLFRAQLKGVLPLLPTDARVLRNLYLSATEPEIAHALDRVAHQNPDVQLGSYPRFEPEVDYRVKLTVEHADPARVDEIVAVLTAALPEGCIVRTE